LRDSQCEDIGTYFVFYHRYVELVVWLKDGDA